MWHPRPKSPRKITIYDDVGNVIDLDNDAESDTMTQPFMKTFCVFAVLMLTVIVGHGWLRVHEPEVASKIDQAIGLASNEE